MVLSDFTQEDFTFPANLSATLQVKPNLMPQTMQLKLMSVREALLTCCFWLTIALRTIEGI